MEFNEKELRKTREHINSLIDMAKIDSSIDVEDLLAERKMVDIKLTKLRRVRNS